MKNFSNFHLQVHNIYLGGQAVLVKEFFGSQSCWYVHILIQVHCCFSIDFYVSATVFGVLCGYKTIPETLYHGCVICMGGYFTNEVYQVASQFNADFIGVIFCGAVTCNNAYMGDCEVFWYVSNTFIMKAIKCIYGMRALSVQLC